MFFLGITQTLFPYIITGILSVIDSNKIYTSTYRFNDYLGWILNLFQYQQIWPMGFIATGTIQCSVNNFYKKQLDIVINYYRLLLKSFNIS